MAFCYHQALRGIENTLKEHEDKIKNQLNLGKAIKRRSKN